jgi:type I restriction enzyme M protein
MSNESGRIGQKLWSYCNLLRDDGRSYQDYLGELTFLLFLKMTDERGAITGTEQSIPKGYRWADLSKSDMEVVKLEAHYHGTLEVLGKQGRDARAHPPQGAEQGSATRAWRTRRT